MDHNRLSSVDSQESLVKMLISLFRKFRGQIIMNRRRMQQRIRRRRAYMTNFFVQQLIDLESSFLEMVVLPGLLGLPSTVSPDARTVDMPAQDFWDHAKNYFNNEQWLDAFHVSRAIFDRICGKLLSVPSVIRHNRESTVSLEKRTAIAIYTLASGSNLSDVAIIFRVKTNDVQRYIRRFAEALMIAMGKSVILMPETPEDCRNIGKAFYNASNMPRAIIGIIGVCEIQWKHPSSSASQETSKNSENEGIIMQVIIDDGLLFRKVHLHSPEPSLFVNMDKELNQMEPHMVNGIMVYPFVIAPPCYGPLRPWLLHRYEDPVAPHEYDFNEAVDNLTQFKEQAFLRFFARWQYLQRRDAVALDHIVLRQITLACCALHNLLEDIEEDYREKWESNLDVTMFATTPSRFQYRNGGSSNVYDTARASELRDFLARTISSTEI